MTPLAKHLLIPGIAVLLFAAAAATPLAALAAAVSAIPVIALLILA